MMGPNSTTSPIVPGPVAVRCTSRNLQTGMGPDGMALRPILHLNVYWFGWVDYYPEADPYTVED